MAIFVTAAFRKHGHHFTALARTSEKARDLAERHSVKVVAADYYDRPETL
ncbi:hypothetical protein ACIPSJ_51690 [Streptomyces sp. NPDC090088]